MAFSKRFARLPWGMQAYVQAGEGDVAAVFLHGIPTSSFLWRHVLPLLQGERACYALDLLGYGDSDKPTEADLSLPAQVGYLKGWADALDLGRFHLVGHDIGGGIAQLFAVRYPERIARIVLVDSVAYDSFPEPSIARLKDASWDGILEARDLRPGFRRALEQGLGSRREVTDELLEAYVAPWLGSAGRRAYLRAARALRTEDIGSAVEAIERLPHPMLILWGEKDLFQNPSYGERLARALPNARLVLCPEGGHFLPEDRPAWVGEQIAAFLKG